MNTTVHTLITRLIWFKKHFKQSRRLPFDNVSEQAHHTTFHLLIKQLNYFTHLFIKPNTNLMKKY